MSEAAYGRMGRRLQRILVMLPYAIRHPGIGVDELARKFGVKRRDLLEDLNLVFLCGLPGYGPGDLIDVTLDEDRVFVRMADYFGAPLRLSPAEALALYAGGAALTQVPGMEEADALRRAVAKLGRALGAPVDVRIDSGPLEHLDALRRAIREHRRVRLEYYSASRGELTERTVEPWGLITALGTWYVVGFDHLSQEERMFRSDRIKSVVITEESADVPADFDPGRYRGAFDAHGGGDVLTLEISPGAARWFEDYYPATSAESLADGWRRIELRSGGTRWAATLLLRLGADVRNVSPAAVVDEARTIAARLAAAHA